jgi:hypothetical protein
LALELKMPKEARERLRDLIIKKQNITVWSIIDCY